jgi:hypothetical protein
MPPGGGQVFGANLNRSERAYGSEGGFERAVSPAIIDHDGLTFDIADLPPHDSLSAALAAVNPKGLTLIQRHRRLSITTSFISTTSRSFV